MSMLPHKATRHRRRSACAWLIAVIGLATPGVAQADVLNAWNEIAQNQTVAIRPTAHGQMRGIAMVQGAVYDAVNALDPDYQPYLLDLAALHAQPFGSQDAAIATAAHRRAGQDRGAWPGGGPRQLVRHDVAGDPGRSDRGRGRPRRRGRCRGDARRPEGRRVHGGVHLQHRPGAGDWRPVASRSTRRLPEHSTPIRGSAISSRS